MIRRNLEPYYEEIIDLYQRGIGTMFISKKLNINRSVIQSILKRKGIKLRRTSPHKHYNIDFFKTYTKESCYWAGFIAADGYIRNKRNTLSIKLQLSDLHHLEKFKKSIQYEGNINISSTYCYIDISGEWFTKNLSENFGILNKKSLTIQFCEKIPFEFLNHFIRGFFDGDGCITKSRIYKVVSFSCGSEKFLKKLQEIFYNNVKIVLQGKNKYPPIQNGKQISYSCKNAKKILDWLYKDSNNDIQLDRKFMRYLEYWG